MNSFLTEDIVEKIEASLFASKDGFSVALLCEKDFSGMLCGKLSERLEVPVILLGPAAEKHKLKRKLNESGCEMILYSAAFEPVVYEIFNDGTTLLRDSLRLEDYMV